MVSWKDLLWSGVGREQRAAVPEISHHNPAAPETAQISGLEEEEGEEGTCKVTLCCRAMRPRPGSQAASLDSGLHKQSKTASFPTGLCWQKMALLPFFFPPPLNFKPAPEPSLLRRPLASLPAPSRDSRRVRSILHYITPGRGRTQRERETEHTHALYGTGIVSPQIHIGAG